MREFFESIRQKEETAIENKNRSRRKSILPPNEIAAQIYNEIQEKEHKLLRKYEADFLKSDQPYDVFDVPEKGEAKIYYDLFIKHGVNFRKGKRHIDTVEVNSECQAKLLCLVSNSEKRGFVKIPHDEKECKRVYTIYIQFLKNRENRLRDLIEERTANEDLQEKVYEALLPMVKS
jgi:hypothetical protein